MISKTQIDKRTRKKRNPMIIRTIDVAKRNNLLELAKRLSGPASNYASINLDTLDKLDEGKILVIGKVLGQGEIGRKFSVAALGFSEQARDKLKKAGCEMKDIIEEIEDNPKLEGVKII
jgi:large subunit ribosomal protein L18e